MNTDRFDLLQVEVHPSRRRAGAAAANTAAEAIRDAQARSGEARVVFACAPSQDEFLAALARFEPQLDWSSVTIFHMDEYAGVHEEHPQSFRRYLREHLLTHISAPRAFHLIEGDALDLLAECGRYAALLAEKPVDLVCLGIGENGHLAFNDPPVADFDDPHLVKVVELDLACRQQQVNDGCFATIEDVPTHALTLTIPALLQARQISGVICGERKAPAVASTLKGPIATTCPASILRRHPRALLHLDEAAASLAFNRADLSLGV